MVLQPSTSASNNLLPRPALPWRGFFLRERGRRCRPNRRTYSRCRVEPRRWSCPWFSDQEQSSGPKGPVHRFHLSQPDFACFAQRAIAGIRWTVHDL